MLTDLGPEWKCLRHDAPRWRPGLPLHSQATSESIEQSNGRALLRAVPFDTPQQFAQPTSAPIVLLRNRWFKSDGLAAAENVVCCATSITQLREALVAIAAA